MSRRIKSIPSTRVFSSDLFEINSLDLPIILIYCIYKLSIRELLYDRTNDCKD